MAALLVWSLTAALRPAEPPLTPVLVAARDLPAGAVLAAEDLTTALLPQAGRPADAPTSPDSLLGHTVVLPLVAGEPVRARDLLTRDLLAGLGEGVVATPVRLSDDSAVTVVRVGDVVDVIAATSGGAASSAASEASVVASHVRVLVAGSGAAGATGDGGLLSGSSATTGSSSLLVLATTPAQALDIARAAVGSRLSVILRAG